MRGHLDRKVQDISIRYSATYACPVVLLYVPYPS
jgi:hypothetical protein